jgi:ArsR family transcriptional regulator, arsenate/arsenite/antimonite-responsive transcriptional repressor
MPYTCIVTQMSKRIRRPLATPRTPRQAASCCRPIDKFLDPALFKALGDPTRASLLSCLAKCGRACSVTEVAECCKVDFSVVSRHLAVLEDAGVVESAKEGRTVLYKVKYLQLAATLRSLADAVESCCADSPTPRGGSCCG